MNGHEEYFIVYKKGNRWDFNKYGGIRSLNAAFEVYAKTITLRLNTINEDTLSEE
jgi:hypothetical protein